ncbi:hypothetical protein ACFYN0_08595 [Streptomyces sp. NPDC006704]|uniref:hypothetical protein n=1 Tax=Streptomyces sp. NPDC006704 TaxID=3364760 RepID=UPI0036A3AB6C
MTLLHTVIHHQGDGTPDRIGLFFETTKYAGGVTNRETRQVPGTALVRRAPAARQPDPVPRRGLTGSLTQPGGLTYHNWPEE